MKYCFLALGTIVLVCVGCITDGAGSGGGLRDRGEHHAPPAAMMQHPGPMVDGPGPGVLAPLPGPMNAAAFVPQKSQVRFINPTGMVVGWQVGPGFAERQLTVPARYDLTQGATYRLKFTNIPDYEGTTLYPTLQVYPSHPSTSAYLSHVSIPVEVTREDLGQIDANNFVTKVIYLPDPKFQELAIQGVSTLVSTELDPGTDPVAEAERRGTIMAVLRVGNMDYERSNALPAGPDGRVEPVNYQIDGDRGQIMDPAPISIMPPNGMRIPSAGIMAGHGLPGQPAAPPIPGMGSGQVWGQPITATPIGLPGPPHLPLGGKAGLQRHIVRNVSDHHIPNPTREMLIDVNLKPGMSVPDPASYIYYEEKHPNIAPGELSHPAWGTPGTPEYCPPPAN